jgi:hypothetical protein
MLLNAVAMAAVMAGVIGVVAAAPEPRPSPPTPAHSPAPPSKYQGAKERYRDSAPADQYFGRMKLSFLGINNTFRDATITSGDHTVDPAIVSKVGIADEALRDWESHFPHDPQLARTYFLAIRANGKIWLKPNQEAAWDYMNRITRLFPTSYFARLIKADLATGFTEHYYADPVPCPTPTPTATPAPVATPTPTVVASPVPKNRPSRVKATPTPTPTTRPTPEPTATPSPTPTPMPTLQIIAKGLKVQIETPACVAAAAPSQSGAPTPAPTLAPAQSPQPATAAPATTSAPTVRKSPSPTP